MSDLSSIKPDIDPAIERLTQGNQNLLSSQLIALRRIRIKSLSLFEDFVVLLKKIKKYDPELYIYNNYKVFLQKQLNDSPFKMLNCFLQKHGFNQKELSVLLINKKHDEGAVANRILNDGLTFAHICVFYLYQPRLTNNFFVNQLKYLDDNEKELIENYRILPEELQNKVYSYIKKMADDIQFRDIDYTKQP